MIMGPSAVGMAGDDEARVVRVGAGCPGPLRILVRICDGMGMRVPMIVPVIVESVMRVVLVVVIVVIVVAVVAVRCIGLTMEAGTV